MKIIMTSINYLPYVGGTEIIMQEIAQYMISIGWQVTVISTTKDSEEICYDAIENVRIIRIPTFEIEQFPFVKKRKDLAVVEKELEDADIVHVNSCKFLYRFFAINKEKYNYKLFVTSHGWIYHTKNHKFIKDLYFKSVVVKYADKYNGIINVSYLDQEIAEKYGIRNSVVILNGVDIRKFSDLPRREFNQNHFLYWGRIANNKGIYECLKKMSELTIDYRFNIIGKCDDKIYEDQIMSFIKEHDMNDKIIFHGQRSDDEIREMMIDTDIILMPSLYEGFGMTLVECLLSGRPIIANKNESYEYILSQTNTSEFLFDFQDPDSDLALKIEELISKQSKPDNVEQFSVETMVHQIARVFGIEE